MAMPTPTPAAISTLTPALAATSASASTVAPILTATSTPIPIATPDSVRPTASSILESAIENLQNQSSYRVVVAVDGSSESTWLQADIVSPDRGRMYEHRRSLYGSQIKDELLTIGDSHYYRPPGFQVWFDAASAPYLQRDIRGFPYELGFFLAGITDLDLRGSGVTEDDGHHLLTGIATQGLAAAIGFYSADAWWRGAAEVEMLISRDDLLPLRFSGGIDGFQASFSARYSNFGADMGVSAPEEVWHFDYLQRSWEGVLSAEEMAQMLRVFPVEGQKCVEVDIGTGLYLKVISGEDFDEDIMKAALWFCEGAIFSVSGDLITPRTDQIDDIVEKWDLNMLSISAEELAEQGLQCIRMSIGRSSLFEIGNGHRPPTLEEVEAVEACKLKGGGEED